MKTKNLVLCGVCAAIMAILSPIPFSIGAIPITLGFFAAFICSGVLPPKLAVTTQIVYLLLGAIGLPVFSNFGGGLEKLVGPTGGFLLGYPLMAFAISFLLEYYDNHIKRGEVLRMMWTVMTLIIGAVIGHVCGALWYSGRMHVTILQALVTATVPFILPEIIKIAAASVLLPILRKRIRPMIKQRG